MPAIASIVRVRYDFCSAHAIRKCNASFNILQSMDLMQKCAEVSRLLGVDFFSVLSMDCKNVWVWKVEICDAAFGF